MEEAVQSLVRAELIRTISRGVALVEFTKVSGEVRRMKCTLHGKLIPPEKFPDDSRSYKNHDVIRVYDLEKQGWRSFRVDSVIDSELLTEYTE
jgi:hypothetical protein